MWEANRRHRPTSCLTSPTFAADGSHHQVWWRNSSGRASWPGPPLLYNIDWPICILCTADEAPCPLRSGHLGTGCGNQSQPFLAVAHRSPLKLLDTLIRTERESPASCPHCHLGMWHSECILIPKNRKDQWSVSDILVFSWIIPNTDVTLLTSSLTLQTHKKEKSLMSEWFRSAMRINEEKMAELK